jgi:hypothetical protein
VPEDIPNREPYFLKAGPFRALPNESIATYHLSSPFEVPSLQARSSSDGPSTNLHDFLSGTPTVGEWNEVSEAINALNPLEFRNAQKMFLGYDLQNDIFDSDNPENVTARIRIVHGYSDLLVRLSYKWPTLNNVREIYFANYSVFIYDTDDVLQYKWRASATQVRGEATFPTGNHTTTVKVNGSSYFSAGDTIGISTPTSGQIIGAISSIGQDEYGDPIFNITYNNTSGSDITTVRGQPIFLISDDTYYDNTFVIYPDTSGEDIQILFPTNTFTSGEQYDVVVQWNYRRKSGSENDPYGEDARMYYVGELINSTYDENDLLPMTPFEACDPIPGDPATPEKTIHRIIENLNLVSAGSSSNMSLSTERTDTDFPVLVGVHRYGYLAYVSEGDVTLKYWDNIEWKTATFTSTSGKVKYARLSSNAPGILDGNFMYITGAQYACEVDYAQGASIRPSQPSI